MCEKDEWMEAGAARERHRILQLFQSMIDDNRKNAFDGYPGWAIWAKKVVENSTSSTGESSAAEK